VLDAEISDRLRSRFALAGAQALGTRLVACAEPARVVAGLREVDASAAATIPAPGLALVR
jgi:hypothetical protein